MFKVSYIYDLVDNITPQLKKIQSTLASTTGAVRANAQSMANSLDKVSATAKKTSQAFKNIGAVMAPASIAMGLVAKKAISSAANFETLGIQLEVLTGSAEKGKQLFQELSTFSAQTPFELPEIVQATRTLLGSNIALKDVVATTKMLGDVSAGSGADIKSLAVVFGQVAGMTKLQGQDAMQFVSNGVPIWALLQKVTGKSVDQLRDLGSKGQISFDLVNKALTQSTEKGGMYYQATLKLSKSLSGLYSTLKDNVNLAFGELGAEMVKAINLQELITEISDFAGKLTDKFKALSPEAKKFITYAVLITTVLAPVLLALGSLIAISGVAFKGLAMLSSGFIMSTNPVGIAIAAIGVLIYTIFNLKHKFVILYNFLKDKFASAFDYIANKIKSVINLINQLRTDASVVLNFVGLEKLGSIVAPPNLNNSTQINKPQQVTAGGQLNVNINGLPKGSNAGFTPIPNNFLPVGVNSVFAGF